MRVLVVVLFAACASDPAPEDRLADFNAMNQVECGGHPFDRCTPDAVGQQDFACMNDALASGARAAYFETSLTSDWFDMSTTWFTADHEVHVFNDYPQGDGHHDKPYAVEEPTCAGPFHAVQSRCPYNVGSADTALALDGCPSN